MNPPALEFIFELKATLDPSVEIGMTPFGARRMVPISGGTFSGPRLSGHVLAVGADWQWAEDSSLTIIDAHYLLETDDGVRIEVRSRGLRHGPVGVMSRLLAGEPVHPSEYYFRTSVFFRPPHGNYEWLRQGIFIGSGERYADSTVVKVWKVL